MNGRCIALHAPFPSDPLATPASLPHRLLLCIRLRAAVGIYMPTRPSCEHVVTSHTHAHRALTLFALVSRNYNNKYF